MAFSEYSQIGKNVVRKILKYLPKKA